MGKALFAAGLCVVVSAVLFGAALRFLVVKLLRGRWARARRFRRGGAGAPRAEPWFQRACVTLCTMAASFYNCALLSYLGGAQFVDTAGVAYTGITVPAAWLGTFLCVLSGDYFDIARCERSHFLCRWLYGAAMFVCVAVAWVPAAWFYSRLS